MDAAMGMMSTALDTAGKGRGRRKAQRAARIAAMELSQRAAAADAGAGGDGHAAGAHIVRNVARIHAASNNNNNNNNNNTAAAASSSSTVLRDAPLKDVEVSAEPRWLAAVGNAVGVKEKTQKMVEEDIWEVRAPAPASGVAPSTASAPSASSASSAPSASSADHGRPFNTKHFVHSHRV